jgi:hypothetical protein
MLSLADAHEAVVDLVEPDADPVLTPDEIDRALARTANAAIWQASTVYAYGQKIVPTVPQGRIFIASIAGTSGVTEPIWGQSGRYYGWYGYPVVVDGTVTFRDAGVFSGEVYDVRAAGAECWRTRARKCFDRVDVSVQGAGSAKESLTYERCMSEARALQPVRIV